jgi:hypothetical protein
VIKVIILICISVIGKFLEKWERENSQRFWSVIMLLAIPFSSFDEIQFQTTQTPIRIDKNIASVLAISGGEKQLDSFVSPSKPGAPPSSFYNSKNPRSRYYDIPKPKYPWGIDPSYNPGGGSGSGGGDPLFGNKVPGSDEWDDDKTNWEKMQEDTCSTSESEEKE